jgi:putative ABC transport system permease protein
MIKNYFKIAFRNLVHNIGYTSIKIIGLAVGILSCILIMLFVKSEWSYDKFHTNADSIYRVWQDEKYEDQNFVSTITPLIMAPTLQANIPEIESTCRIVNIDPIISLNNQDFNEQVLAVDNAFFDIFDFKLINGNIRNPFPNLNTIVVSKTTSKKLFGNTSAIGQTLELLLGEDKKLFTVSAIIDDAPKASSIQYSMIIPFENITSIYSKRAQNSWFNVFGETYVLLKSDTELAKITSKFPNMMKQALGENYSPGGFEVYLQPIKEIHLDNTLPQGIQPISNPKYSYILATIGILILLLACANFIILAIGHSSSRAKEVGVRKVMGAERPQLIRQFMSEAFIITSLSLFIGLCLSLLLLKPFNTIIRRDLSIPLNVSFVLFCLVLVIIIAFISGFYPAVILSKYNPVRVLKGEISTKGNAGIFRRSLIVGQFVISVSMLICTLVISQQISYFKTKDLGYDKEQKIVVPTNLNRKDGNALAALYRTELLKHPEVKNVTVSLYSFAEPSWVTLGFTNDSKEYKSFQYNTVDSDFIETMNIRLKEGRSFNKLITSDINNAAIVNESFVKEFGLTNPIGMTLPGGFEQQIVGVVEDFNYQSLHTPVSPLLLTIKADSIFRKSENVNILFPPEPRLSISLLSGNPKANVDILKATWKQVAPNQDFEYIFLDQSINSQYVDEVRTSTIVKIASGLSIFIASIGLFGLVTLIIARKRKEIGIRKVLGANVGNIVGLLSLDFAKLIIVAAIIAFPLSWWFMNDWLKDFAYRIDIKWWVFVLSACLAMVIALITISFQAVKVALSNPVKSLRTE